MRPEGSMGEGCVKAWGELRMNTLQRSILIFARDGRLSSGGQARLLPCVQAVLIYLHFFSRESVSQKHPPRGATGPANITGGLPAFIKHNRPIFGQLIPPSLKIIRRNINGAR